MAKKLAEWGEPLSHHQLLYLSWCINFGDSDQQIFEFPDGSRGYYKEEEDCEKCHRKRVSWIVEDE